MVDYPDRPACWILGKPKLNRIAGSAFSISDPLTNGQMVTIHMPWLFQARIISLTRHENPVMAVWRRLSTQPLCQNLGKLSSFSRNGRI